MSLSAKFFFVGVYIYVPKQLKFQAKEIIMSQDIFNKSKNPAIPQEIFDRLIH